MSQYQHLPFHPLGRNEHLVHQVECTPHGKHIPRTQHTALHCYTPSLYPRWA
jgi:hypothetical protein